MRKCIVNKNMLSNNRCPTFKGHFHKWGLSYFPDMGSNCTPSTNCPFPIPITVGIVEALEDFVWDLREVYFFKNKNDAIVHYYKGQILKIAPDFITFLEDGEIND